MVIPSSLQISAPTMGCVHPESATMSSILSLLELLFGKTVALKIGLKLSCFTDLAFNALNTDSPKAEFSSSLIDWSSSSKLYNVLLAVPSPTLAILALEALTGDSVSEEEMMS